MTSIVQIITSLFIFIASQAFANVENNLIHSYPGDTNTKSIQVSEIKSSKAKETIQNIDLAFEMGDGYYDELKSAVYLVFSSEGQVAGFMKVSLLSYTEGSEIFLVAAYVDTSGRRLGDVYRLNSFQDLEDIELQNLPIELRP